MISVNERLNLLLDLRRYADAERAAREAIGRDPQWASAYTHLARALMGLNKKEAIDAAREGARKAPHDAWAVGTLACALNWFNMSKEALQPAEEALRLDPRYAWAYAMLANILYNLNRFGDARAKALQGLQIDPLSESLFRWKGWAEHKMGEQAEALRTAEEALKHHPNSHLLLNLIGCIKWTQAEKLRGLKRLRAHRDAEAILRESIRLEPTQAAYRDNLRGNAVSCRKHVVGNALTMATITSAVVPVCLILVLSSPADRPRATFALFSCGLFALLALLFAASERFALTLPLDRFRVPGVPTTRRERLFVRLALCGYLVLLLAPSAIAAWWFFG
jgi:tetratricopeptide (TPR) repeat protein